jgi:hypothetical protein
MLVSLNKNWLYNKISYQELKKIIELINLSIMCATIIKLSFVINVFIVDFSDFNVNWRY